MALVPNAAVYPGIAVRLKQITSWLGFRLRTIELLPFLFVSAGRCELVLLTAADSSHFKSLCQLLSSALRHEPTTPVVAYDLGMARTEREFLHVNFPAVDLRIFDYSRYPDYFNIQIEKGQFAWKPVIIREALNEFRSTVVWMDAGNVVTRRLTWLRKIVSKLGMYAARSTGSIHDWTHPATLEYLNVSVSLLGKYNLGGGMVAVDATNLRVHAMVERWSKCALTQECIAPEGSNRRNHRQDQSVLSILAHQDGITKAMPRKRYGYKVQQDID